MMLANIAPEIDTVIAATIASATKILGIVGHPMMLVTVQTVPIVEMEYAIAGKHSLLVPQIVNRQENVGPLVILAPVLFPVLTKNA